MENEKNPGVPALNKSTNVEELLYMLGHREFIIYKHEEERKSLYGTIYQLESKVSSLQEELEKIASIPSKPSRRKTTRTRVLSQQT